MKKLFLVFISSLLFAACSPKQAEFSMLEQENCRDEQQIKNPGEFQAMTVDNLIVDHQNEKIFLTFDVRTYCNADLDMEMREKEVSTDVVINLSNNNTQTGDCVCVKKVRGQLSDLRPGTYTLKIMDKAGTTLYASEDITYNLPD